MNRPPPEERFSKNAAIMAQAIYVGVKKLHDDHYKVVDPNLICLVAEIIKQYDPHKLITGFIKNSHETCWDKIYERDEAYFIEHAPKIFEMIPADTVHLFRDLFLTKDQHGQSVISESLKTQIWKLFDSNIKISIQYAHLHRELFPTVDVNKHAALWHINL